LRGEGWQGFDTVFDRSRRRRPARCSGPGRARGKPSGCMRPASSWPGRCACCTPAPPRLHRAPAGRRTDHRREPRSRAKNRSPVSLKTAVELMTAAHSALPQLSEARIIRLDRNLRPALPDHEPHTDVGDGLIRINGLFRHGWLLAPALVDDVLAAARLLGAGPTAARIDAGMNAPITITVALDGQPHQIPAGTTLAALVAGTRIRAERRGHRGQRTIRRPGHCAGSSSCRPATRSCCYSTDRRRVKPAGRFRCIENRSSTLTAWTVARRHAAQAASLLGFGRLSVARGAARMRSTHPERRFVTVGLKRTLVSEATTASSRSCARRWPPTTRRLLPNTAGLSQRARGDRTCDDGARAVRDGLDQARSGRRRIHVAAGSDRAGRCGPRAGSRGLRGLAVLHRRPGDLPPAAGPRFVRC